MKTTTNDAAPVSLMEQAEALILRLRDLGIRLSRDGDGHYRVPSKATGMLTVGELCIAVQPAVLTAAYHRLRLAHKAETAE